MDSVWGFLNSSFFVAIISLVAGFIAYWLYRKRNKDSKKDAANILLLEIQNAERQLRAAKERLQKDGLVVDNAYVMPTENWSKYKYMFVRDFDRDEWDTINAFYDKCHLYDEAVRHKSASFKNNEAEIRANIHRITSDYIKTLVEGGTSKSARAKTLTLIETFQNEYLDLRSDLNLYQPSKPITEAKGLLEGINDNLSQTSPGVSLKKLANLKQKI